MARFYEEVTVVATFAADGGRDIGFVARQYKFVLQSGGPVDISFDGSTVHGTLGPSGTRAMELITTTTHSRVWVQGAGSEVIGIGADN
jgi:hypothetical protein